MRGVHAPDYHGRDGRCLREKIRILDPNVVGGSGKSPYFRGLPRRRFARLRECEAKDRYLLVRALAPPRATLPTLTIAATIVASPVACKAVPKARMVRHEPLGQPGRAGWLRRSFRQLQARRATCSLPALTFPVVVKTYIHGYFVAVATSHGCSMSGMRSTRRIGFVPGCTAIVCVGLLLATLNVLQGGDRLVLGISGVVFVVFVSYVGVMWLLEAFKGRR